MLNNQNFIDRLKKVLDFYTISAANFAETIDVPRSSISHILSGRNKPSLEFVLKIIETYQDIDLYWLLKGIGSFPKSNTPTPTSALNPIETSKQVLVKKSSTPQQQPEKQKSITHPPKNQRKNIEKVLFFYTDGTFDEFENNAF